ncbi:replication-relaxation family protein [Peribacillus loiseleuriae]|uniref:replication-relaxation family protein n=1 Tax=Peribacillus loiseleuriae TaxID=1679170 RepID=UPI003D06AD93
MRKRDLEILKSLEKFKVLSRDQIASLHFSNNARPHISANNVLKRLRRDGYILANCDRSFEQYIYFINPSPIKIDSQKIDHHLMINQGYIDMQKYGKVNTFEIESKLENADFRSDAMANWLGCNWFIEFQNSLYSIKQLYDKINKYVEYYNNCHWKDEKLLIVGKINMKFNPNDYPFKVKQIDCIDELKLDIQAMQEKRLMEFKGKVKGNNRTPVNGSNGVAMVLKSNGNGTLSIRL